MSFGEPEPSEVEPPTKRPPVILPVQEGPEARKPGKPVIRRAEEGIPLGRIMMDAREQDIIRGMFHDANRLYKESLAENDEKEIPAVLALVNHPDGKTTIEGYKVYPKAAFWKDTSDAYYRLTRGTPEADEAHEEVSSWRDRIVGDLQRKYPDSSVATAELHKHPEWYGTSLSEADHYQQGVKSSEGRVIGTFCRQLDERGAETGNIVLTLYRRHYEGPPANDTPGETEADKTVYYASHVYKKYPAFEKIADYVIPLDEDVVLRPKREEVPVIPVKKKGPTVHETVLKAGVRYGSGEEIPPTQSIKREPSYVLPASARNVTLRILEQYGEREPFVVLIGERSTSGREDDQRFSVSITGMSDITKTAGRYYVELDYDKIGSIQRNLGSGEEIIGVLHMHPTSPLDLPTIATPRKHQLPLDSFVIDHTQKEKVMVPINQSRLDGGEESIKLLNEDLRPYEAILPSGSDVTNVLTNFGNRSSILMYYRGKLYPWLVNKTKKGTELHLSKPIELKKVEAEKTGLEPGYVQLLNKRIRFYAPQDQILEGNNLDTALEQLLYSDRAVKKIRSKRELKTILDELEEYPAILVRTKKGTSTTLQQLLRESTGIRKGLLKSARDILLG